MPAGADSGGRALGRLLGLADILDRFIRSIRAHEQQRSIVFRSANPSIFWPIEFDFFVASELCQIKTGGDGTQSETVRFCHVVNIVRGDHRACTGHVLDDDFWISRKMFSQVSRVGTGPQIMGIAGEITDGDPDRFALKEWRLRCSVRGAHDYYQETEQGWPQEILLQFVISCIGSVISHSRISR